MKCKSTRLRLASVTRGARIGQAWPRHDRGGAWVAFLYSRRRRPNCLGEADRWRSREIEHQSYSNIRTPEAAQLPTSAGRKRPITSSTDSGPQFRRSRASLCRVGQDLTTTTRWSLYYERSATAEGQIESRQPVDTRTWVCTVSASSSRRTAWMDARFSNGMYSYERGYRFE
jgi:hypothetical protein